MKLLTIEGKNVRAVIINGHCLPLNINNKRMNMYTLDYAIKKNEANIKEMLETIIIRPKYYKFLTEKEKIYGDIRLWSSELLNKIDNEFILKYM